MTPRTVRSLIIAATFVALASPSLPAAPNVAPAHGFWASKVTVTTWNTLLKTRETHGIAAGTSRSEVVRLLGQPREMLTPDVYLYDNCRPEQSVARECADLIIAFSQDRVVSMRFVNHTGTAVIATNLRNRIGPAAETAFADPNE